MNRRFIFLFVPAFFILSVEAQALKGQASRYPIAPDYKKGNVLCPSGGKALAKEMVLLESMGRRALAQAKDSCYKKAKVSYVYKLKGEDDYTKEIVFVKTVGVTKVKYNKKYAEYEVSVEAVGVDGKKYTDAFRFKQMAKAGKKRPEHSCAIQSSNMRKSYVLYKCKASK